ncbi:hypothetical protein TcCL_ESM05651 [Trypanosoma cruzi]|nr:hypothetical protein TcCL_ESM05651 [Trypanosoma cruzi]
MCFAFNYASILFTAAQSTLSRRRSYYNTKDTQTARVTGTALSANKGASHKIVQVISTPALWLLPPLVCGCRAVCPGGRRAHDRNRRGCVVTGDRCRLPRAVPVGWVLPRLRLHSPLFLLCWLVWMCLLRVSLCDCRDALTACSLHPTPFLFPPSFLVGIAPCLPLPAAVRAGLAAAQ